MKLIDHLQRGIFDAGGNFAKRPNFPKNRAFSEIDRCTCGGQTLRALTATQKRVVVVISGASGADLALDLAELIAPHCKLYVVLSSGAKRAIVAEARGLEQGKSQLQERLRALGAKATLLAEGDLAHKIASGSFHIDAYFAYASANFTCAAAVGLAHNLPLRAVAVALKERRRIVIAPREMPASRALLRAMSELDAAGAIIAPPLYAAYAACSAREFLLRRWAALLGFKQLFGEQFRYQGSARS